MSNKVSGIQVKIIADSNNQWGKRLTTFELVYPRVIHGENLTHRMFSKNGASSRAIPVKDVIDMVRSNPAMLSRYGANQSGMQDKGAEHTELIELPWTDVKYSARDLWELAARDMCDYAEAFDKADYHKQVPNRLLEPFQWMKVVLTGTEFKNFFWLRDHPAADPTFQDLASNMHQVYNESVPVDLNPGDWHVPYYYDGVWVAAGVNEEGENVDIHNHTLQEALEISMSCCAQVSYRKLDDSQEKAKRVVSRLNLNGEQPEDPAHASPSEHQGTPMKFDPMVFNNFVENGVTSYHKDLGHMSGNLAGWIQNRQLIPNTTKW